MFKIFFICISIFLVVSTTFYFRTESFFVFGEEVKLKLAGVESKYGEFQYFEKSNCANLEECQCILLIHGLGDTAFTWGKMLSQESRYQQNRRFFAINLPGSYETPKLSNPEEYGFDNLSARIRNIMADQECKNWVVVGNSYGAWLAVDLAIKNSKIINGLLLLDPAGLKKDYGNILGFFLNPDLEVAKDFYNKSYYAPINLPDFVFERVVDRIKTRPVIDQLKAIQEKDYLDHRLGHLTMPVSYVWGEADRVLPSEWGLEFQEKTPGSTLKIVPQCGHIPQKECLPEVMAAFEDLLKKTR